jgi:hypothetical protein
MRPDFRANPYCTCQVEDSRHKPKFGGVNGSLIIIASRRRQ